MILLGRNFLRGSEGSGIFEEFRNNFKTFVKNVQVPNWNLNYPRTFFDSSISHFLWKKILHKQKIQTWLEFINITFPLEINSIKTSKIKKRTIFDSSISHFLWKEIWQKQKIQTWLEFIYIAFPLEIDSIKTSKI